MPSAVVCAGPSIEITDYVCDMGDLPVSFTSFITNKTTHYVTTKEEVDKSSTRVISAQRKNIDIVSESFLKDCITSNTIVDSTPYLLVSKQVTKDLIADITETIQSETEQKSIVKRKLDPLRKREIKIFISSTFRDMKEERSLLISKIFPQLHSICQQRNVLFSFVDLRWGITETDAKNSRTLEMCLDAIDDCRPYFIGFLGERYGWAQNEGFSEDNALTETFNNASLKYPWVLDYKDRGIMELEAIYGALQPQLYPNYKELPPEESSCHRSFFFFRDPLSITKRFELGDPERKNYEEESEDGHRKLRELKNTIRASGLPLIDGYSIENLSSHIMKALTIAIDEDFPDDEPAAKQRNLNGMNSKNIYYKFDSVHAALDNYSSSSTEYPFFIYGGEGTGKSTTLVHWMDEKINEGRKVFSYSINETPSCDSLVKKLFNDFAEEFFLKDFEIPRGTDESIRISLSSLFEAIDFQLKKKNSKIIIGILGFHHYSSIDWFPSSIPSNIRIVLTSNDIPKGNNTKNGKLLPIWKGKDKDSFLTQYLKLYTKKLENSQKTMIINSPATSNPLFLKTILDQLIHVASFDNLTASLSHYLSAKNIHQLFQFIFADWEKLFNNGNLMIVSDTLISLSLCNRGLTEDEMKTIVNYNGSEWSPFFYTLKGFLRSTQSGFVLYHNSMYQAIASRYFIGNKKEEILCRMAQCFESLPLFRAIHELPFIYQKLASGNTQRLLDFLCSPINVTLTYTTLSIEDLVSLWNSTKNIYKLSPNIIDNDCSIDVLSTILEVAELLFPLPYVIGFIQSIQSPSIISNREFKVLYSRYLEESGNYELALIQIDSVLNDLIGEQIPSNLLALKGLILKKLGQYDDAKLSFENAIWKLSNTPKDLISLSQYKSSLGDIERKLGNYYDALKYYNESFDELSKLIGNSHLKLVDIHRNIGLTYKKKAEYDKAKNEYAKALHILEKKNLNTGQQYGFILGEIADVYRKTAAYNTAKGFYESSLNIIKSCCGDKHPEVAEVLNSMGILLKKQGKYAEALPIYEESLDIIKTIFGTNHYKYATGLNNIGDLHRKTGNFEQAILFYTDAQKVFSVTLGEEHAEYAEVSNNIGLVYKKQGNYPLALQAYENAIRITFKQFGAAHVKVGIYLSNLADVFRKQGKYQKALQTYDQAFDIICRCLGIQDAEIADIRQSRALVYIEQDKFDTADADLTSASNIIRRTFGEQHPKMGFCLHKRGMLEFAKGNISQAIEVLEKSLKILKQTLDKYHPEVADVLITLGEVQSVKDSSAALISFKTALEIIFFCFGKEHYKYKSISNSIHSLGGSIPQFKLPKVSKTSGKQDWRKALDSLIAQSSSKESISNHGNTSKKGDSNTQAVLIAMSSGLI